MGAGDFTGPATATAVTATPRGQAGAKSALGVTVSPTAQAGAKSTATVVMASRPSVGANAWSNESTALDVTETAHDDGILDLAGALAQAATVAAAAGTTGVSDPQTYAYSVRAAGAAIRRYGGDRVRAGVKDADGWIGRVLDIYRTHLTHGTEGVVGFCVNGVDFTVWPYEELVTVDLVAHPGINVGGGT